MSRFARDTQWCYAMKPSGIATSLSLVGTLLCLSATRLALLTVVEARADNSVNVADIDFGAVTQGQAYAASTIVPNRSSRPLRILEVRAGCGCTGVRVEDRTIVGYGSTVLRCDVNTGIMKGRVSKPITLVWKHDGDEVCHHSTLRVNMTVQPDFTIEPQSVEVLASRESEQIVTVRMRDPQKMRLVDASPSNAAFTTRITSTSAEATAVQIAFDPIRLAEPKPGRFAIIMRFEGTAEETASIPLMIREN